MIDISAHSIYGWTEAVRGMRNSWNSWANSDSNNDILGERDLKLMNGLALAGPSHAKYRRMIAVYIDISAPIYWWKEFDTYKVGTVTNSTSTMHTVTKKPFDISDFSCEKLDGNSETFFAHVIRQLNHLRDRYSNEIDPDKKKDLWYQIIQLLPESYNQKRTVMLNYEVLANIYNDRKYHKLDEWREFCAFIETLPYADGLIFQGDQTTDD